MNKHVSIHAPAWGATRLLAQLGDHGAGVSIHAPAWGATGRDIAYLTDELGFNPRTRVGCD